MMMMTNTIMIYIEESAQVSRNERGEGLEKGGEKYVVWEKVSE